VQPDLDSYIQIAALTHSYACTAAGREFLILLMAKSRRSEKVVANIFPLPDLEKLLRQLPNEIIYMVAVLRLK
jgi:hypothetical protein